MDRNFEMTRLEEVLKAYYEGDISQAIALFEGPEMQDSPQYRLAETILWKKNGLEKELFEDEYFKNCDVSVSLHPRYMPAFSHRHDFFEFVYLLKGKCVNVFDGITHEMVPGEFFLMPTGVMHSISVYDDESVVMNILVRRSTFEENFAVLLKEQGALSDFYGNILYDRSFRTALSFETKGALEDLMLKLYEESEREDACRNRIVNAYFQLIMGYIARDFSDRVSFIGSRDQENTLAADALRYINAHLSEVTLDDLSSTLGYSSAHLSRLLTRYTGQGFAGTLRQARLKKAAIMLKDFTSMPVESVMEAVGYTGKSHFYDNFREMYGTTPDRYRKGK